MNYTEVVGEKLNTLLKKTYDAEKLFKKAAQNADSPDLKDYFIQRANERFGFGHNLKNEIMSFGQEVEREGSPEGKMRRGWMDLKALFSTNNDRSMLEEAIAGEKAAIEEYKDILKETNLPSSTEVLLTQQMTQISHNLSTIKRLEDIA